MVEADVGKRQGGKEALWMTHMGNNLLDTKLQPVATMSEEGRGGRGGRKVVALSFASLGSPLPTTQERKEGP